MFTWAHFFTGILMAAVGTVMLKFNFRLVGITGRQAWIENHLGSGTTYLVYQVFAVLIVLLGIIYAIGAGDTVIGWLLSPLNGIFQGFRGPQG